MEVDVIEQGTSPSQGPIRTLKCPPHAHDDTSNSFDRVSIDRNLQASRKRSPATVNIVLQSFMSAYINISNNRFVDS